MVETKEKKEEKLFLILCIDCEDDLGYCKDKNIKMYCPDCKPEDDDTDEEETETEEETDEWGW